MPFRRNLLVAAFVGLTAPALAAPLAIDIPAQPLAEALKLLAQRAQLTISVDAALLAGKTAPALKGSMEPAEALRRLLAGSGLEPAPAAGGGFIVRRAAPAAADQTLPEVRVVDTRGGLQPRSASTLGPLGELPLLDTPYSVSVIPQELIRNENPTRLTEALRYVPGIMNNQAGGSYYDQVMIRGFETSNLSNYRKNNMPMMVRGDTAFENIERLEIYKGPSAMFYGFNSPGGVINYVTKRAPAAGFIAGGMVGLNEYGGWRISADVGGRVAGGDLGYRVNLGYEDIANHIRDFQGKRDMASIALDWKLGDRTLLQFDYDQQYKRTHVQPGIGMLNAAQIPGSLDARKFYGQSWTYHIADSRDTAVQLTHELAKDWSLRIAGNVGHVKRPYKYSNVQLDNKDTGAGQVFEGQYTQDYDSWSGVFQLDGKVRTGIVTQDLTFGYSPERIIYDEHRMFFAGGVFNVYNPTPRPEPNGTFGALRKTTFTNRATYVADRISIGQQWQAIVGARHNDFAQTFTGTPMYSKTKVTPTLGLVFKPLPAMSIYGSYMEGLERGGTAPLAASNAGQLMPPLVSEQYEGGVKFDLARGLSLTAAYFEITKPSEYNRAGTWVQDGKQVNKGFEFGVAGQASHNLSLFGGFTLLDAKLKETGTPALNGKSPAGVPETAFSLYGDYRIPGLEGWYVNGGIVHVGSRPVFADNSGKAPAYTLLNLGARYEFKAGAHKARILVNLDNATDKFYWDTVDSFGTMTIGVPRTFRVAAQFDY